MKRILLLYMVFLLALTTYSQAYYASVEEPKINAQTISYTEYDGNENYLGNKVYLYLGETLMLKCDVEKVRNDESFILGFTTGYKILKDEYGYIYPGKYHPTKNNIGTDYHTIADNLFKVINIYSHPWAKYADKNNEYNNVYYLQLHNLTLNDTVYYEYIAENKDRYFPFIVTKYHSYLKSKHVGKLYQVNGNQDERLEVEDYKTHQKINIIGKSWWKCIDVIVNKNDCQLSLVLENKGYKIIASLLTMKYCFKEVN